MKELKISDVKSNLVAGREFIVTQDCCSNCETIEKEAAADNYELPDRYNFQSDDTEAVEVLESLSIDRTPAYVNLHGKVFYPESLLELKDLR